MLPSPTKEQVRVIAQAMGDPKITKKDLENLAFDIFKDALTVRRVLDWLPELFGYFFVMSSHHSRGLQIEQVFSAVDASGRDIRFDYGVEPICEVGFQVAYEIHKNGDIDIFNNIAYQSAIVRSLTSALKDNQSLDGCVYSGPALIGIPAETYIDEGALKHESLPR